MSEETARALEDAVAHEARCRAEADELKKTLLDTIAANIQDRFEEHAKKVALAQPDVTKTLGREGVQKLRAAIRFDGEAVAYSLRSAHDDMTWPARDHRSRTIHDAVSNYLLAHHTKSGDAVFRQNGYQIDDSTSLRVNPADLVEMQWCEALAPALDRLKSAGEAVTEAKRLDDDAAVNDLWD